MNHVIPVSVIDNFLVDPDYIRKWALSQDFFPDPVGRWPGLRTKALYELNSGLNEYINRKYFSLFFDLSKVKVYWEVQSYFQLITKEFDEGWVHTDPGTILTGVVYLTPNAELNSGTSIYRRKYYDNFGIKEEQQFMKEKFQDYVSMSGKNSVDVRKINNDSFEETIRINNVYNRLLTFDSYLYHRANHFQGEEKENSRLTLVIFVDKLMVNETPIQRSRSFI